jgi:hypothetical protein
MKVLYTLAEKYFMVIDVGIKKFGSVLPFNERTIMVIDV